MEIQKNITTIEYHLSSQIKTNLTFTIKLVRRCICIHHKNGTTTHEGNLRINCPKINRTTC